MSHDRGGGPRRKPTAPPAGRGQGVVEGVQSPQHGQGPLPPLYGAPSASAAHEQLNAPIANAAANPPASVAAALGLGLGLGRESSGSVGASSAGAASSWTWPSMGATSPTAGGRLRVSGIVAQPQDMGALAVESRALVTVVRRKRAGLT